MKRRAAIVEVGFDFLDQSIFGEGAQIHLARLSYTDNGRQIIEFYITHPALDEIEEGVKAPRKTMEITMNADGAVTNREFK